jgi:hypothetical protein
LNLFIQIEARMKTAACLIVLSACAAMGCERRLTPELEGLAMRPVDAHNQFRTSSNQNFRSMSDDIARLWYTDSPSRLSPFPVTPTSGQPR